MTDHPLAARPRTAFTPVRTELRAGPDHETVHTLTALLWVAGTFLLGQVGAGLGAFLTHSPGGAAIGGGIGIVGGIAASFPVLRRSHRTGRVG